MSQPDLLSQLQDARPIAPAELREHVRRIAAQAVPEPRRRLNWRRGLMVAVPVCAAAIAAVALIPGSTSRSSALQQIHSGTTTSRRAEPAISPPPDLKATAGSLPRFSSGGAGTTAAAAVPAPSSRTQRYRAALELRVPSTQAVSDDTKQVVQIARSLGGYPSSLDVDASGRTGYATIVLRVPKQNVQKAVARLSALGTIVGESVSVQDLQTQVDATSQKIARLNRSLAGWKALPQTAETQQHIDALTAEIQRLERARSTTVRTASLATVNLQLTTRPAAVVIHHGHGPLHGLAVAFRWAGIGAVYALALGAPVAVLLALGWLVARTVRRRREESLLSRS